MTEQRGAELFTRHGENPILTAADWPYPCNTVFNPAATIVDGETLLLVRVEDLRGHSHLTVARSADGFTDWRIDETPALRPSPETHPEEEWGLEDARITRLDGEDLWAVTYTAYSFRGPLVSLATTRDFRSFQRVGIVLPPENKDAALFPKRIGGRWAMLHRPVPSGGGAHVWISYSPDRVHWGAHQVVLTARTGAWWDAGKVGLSPQPLWTDEGWLILYHGVKNTAGGCIYRLGLALLDADEPSRVLARSDGWVMGPREPYEQIGDVGNVVFPCGWVARGDEVRIYYGGADTCIGVASASLSDLLAACREE